MASPVTEESPITYYGAIAQTSRNPERRWSSTSMENCPPTPLVARKASFIPTFTSRVSNITNSALSRPVLAPPLVHSPVTDAAAELSAYSSPLNALLFCTFFGLLGHLFNFNEAVVFVLVFIGMLPLAMLLGKATEDISDHTSETIGALVNVTFGNAVELIISIVALHAGKLQLIQDTIAGSVLSNLLLVLGSAFFFGGLRYKEQVVLPAVCETSADLLSFAVFSFSIPALFDVSVPGSGVNEKLSLVTSIGLLLIYGMYMWFQLYTHADMYNEPSKRVSGSNIGNSDLGSDRDVEEPIIGRLGSSRSTQTSTTTSDRRLPALATAILVLGLVVMLVACSSEVLVQTLDSFSAHIGLSTKFIAVILLPVIGNAVEHVSAVFVARRNKIDLSVGIACGSSLQIALFAAPLLVIISWIFGYQHLTLNFQLFETICIGFTVLVVNATMRDSRTNWLEGAVLIVCYFILATAFFFIE